MTPLGKFNIVGTILLIPFFYWMFFVEMPKRDLEYAEKIQRVEKATGCKFTGHPAENPHLAFVNCNGEIKTWEFK